MSVYRNGFIARYQDAEMVELAAAPLCQTSKLVNAAAWAEHCSNLATVIAVVAYGDEVDLHSSCWEHLQQVCCPPSVLRERGLDHLELPTEPVGDVHVQQPSFDLRGFSPSPIRKGQVAICYSVDIRVGARSGEVWNVVQRL